MKIHGAVYLLVGLITTVVSSFIPNFLVFIVVGVIFMAIGIGKLILGAKPKENRSQQVHYKQARSNPNQMQSQPNQNIQRQQMDREQYQQYQQFLAYQRMQNQGRQR